MENKYKHLHEQLPKSEKILLDLLYEFDQLAYKNYDLPALSREILTLFSKGFAGYNCVPAINIYYPDKIMLKVENGKIVNASEEDFQNSDTVPITIFNEQTFKEDEVGRITFPTGEGLEQDEKDILFFIFSVLSQKTARLIESAIKRVAVQNEKLELQEKNQLLENIHMFMMQATAIVTGSENEEQSADYNAIEYQKIVLYQALKDAMEINFWIEPVVIFANIAEDKKNAKYVFENVFQPEETVEVKKNVFDGSFELNLEDKDAFMGLNYTFVNYMNGKPVQIFGLGNCNLSEDGKISTVVLETIQLMLNIFSLSFQTILRKEALFNQSVKDGLTGLFNRRHFDNALKLAVERSKRNVDYCFSLIMFDIDHFKKFNDTYGHQTGDEVLQQVAEFVQDTIRKTDVFCRYGGEEFAVILCGSDAEQGFLVAEKIRKVVERIKIQTPIDTTKVTISLGVAQYLPGDDEEEMIKKADSALYQSKERGRNRSSVFIKEA